MAGRGSRTNSYFIPRDGIDREVITADICRYLGNDALVRPFVNDGSQGYLITAYRNLTSSMIEDLRADSIRWDRESARLRLEVTLSPLRGGSSKYISSETFNNKPHRGSHPPEAYPEFEEQSNIGYRATGYTGSQYQQQMSYPPPSNPSHQTNAYPATGGVHNGYRTFLSQNHHVFPHGQAAGQGEDIHTTSESTPASFHPGADFSGQLVSVNGQLVPGQLSSGQLVSGQLVSGQIVSGQQLAGQQLSGQQLSGQQLSGQQLAGQLAGQHFSGHLMSGQQHPGQQHPGQQHPGQQYPQQHPGQQHPGQQHLGQQHLGQQHLGQQHLGQQHLGQQHLGQQQLGQQYSSPQHIGQQMSGHQLSQQQVSAGDRSHNSPKLYRDSWDTRNLREQREQTNMNGGHFIGRPVGSPENVQTAMQTPMPSGISTIPGGMLNSMQAAVPGSDAMMSMPGGVPNMMQGPLPGSSGLTSMSGGLVNAMQPSMAGGMSSMPSGIPTTMQSMSGTMIPPSANGPPSSHPGLVSRGTMNAHSGGTQAAMPGSLAQGSHERAGAQIGVGYAPFHQAAGNRAMEYAMSASSGSADPSLHSSTSMDTSYGRGGYNDQNYHRTYPRPVPEANSTAQARLGSTTPVSQDEDMKDSEPESVRRAPTQSPTARSASATSQEQGERPERERDRPDRERDTRRRRL